MALKGQALKIGAELGDPNEGPHPVVNCKPTKQVGGPGLAPFLDSTAAAGCMHAKPASTILFRGWRLSTAHTKPHS